MFRGIPSSRAVLARAVQHSRNSAARRTFIRPTAIRQADMVQDLYLQHLKGYKPTPVKPGDEKGHVHEFKAPKTPSSPEESNLANDLKAYEDQAVEVEGREAGAVEEVEEDWFEEEEEEESESKH